VSIQGLTGELSLLVSDSWWCCTLVDVDSRPPPIIYHGPQNQTLPVNSVATLSCSASGEPSPVISWYRNHRVIPPHDHRFTILQSGALQITGPNCSLVSYLLTRTIMTYCIHSFELPETMRYIGFQPRRFKSCSQNDEVHWCLAASLPTWQSSPASLTVALI